MNDRIHPDQACAGSGRSGKAAWGGPVLAAVGAMLLASACDPAGPGKIEPDTGRDPNAPAAAESTDGPATRPAASDPADGTTTRPTLHPSTRRTSTDSDASDDDARPSLIRVAGNEATWDIGQIQVNSVHEGVFEVVNGSARPLRIVRVMTDCECTEAIDPPKEIPAGGSAKVRARFTAPKVPLHSYKSNIILVTDRSDRRLIRLWMKSRIVR